MTDPAASRPRWLLYGPVAIAFLAGAPYLMVELLQRPSSEYGLYFMMNALSYMAGNFASGRLATRIGAERMIFTGSVLALAGVGLLTGGGRRRIILAGWSGPCGGGRGGWGAAGYEPLSRFTGVPRPCYLGSAQ